MTDILEKITKINQDLDCKIRNRVGIDNDVKLFDYYVEE